MWLGNLGKTVFLKSKVKCFYRLEIGTMHCNAFLYISYTWHYLYILFQQNNLLLSNITCIQIGNSHTHKYANLVNFTGKLRTCWISVRSTSTSSLHQNVAHEPRSRIFSFDLTEHWTLNTEHWTLNSEQWSNENTKHWDQWMLTTETWKANLRYLRLAHVWDFCLEMQDTWE